MIRPHLPLYPEFTIVERLANHLPSTASTSSKLSKNKGSFRIIRRSWYKMNNEQKYAEQLLNNDAFIRSFQLNESYQ